MSARLVGAGLVVPLVTGGWNLNSTTGVLHKNFGTVVCNHHSVFRGQSLQIEQIGEWNRAKMLTINEDNVADKVGVGVCECRNGHR